MRKLTIALACWCLVTSMGWSTVRLAAQAPETPEAALRRYTACWTRELGVTPRWNVEVTMETDTTSDYFGSTRFSALALEATVHFNVANATRHKQNLRELALHEVLHVALGELAHLAYTTDRDIAGIEYERLIRQMVRWPNWKGVCE